MTYLKIWLFLLMRWPAGVLGDAPAARSDQSVLAGLLNSHMYNRATVVKWGHMTLSMYVTYTVV